MNNMDNYPDNIRQFDDDPRSPFYQGSTVRCEECREICEEEDMSETDDTVCFICMNKREEEE